MLSALTVSGDLGFALHVWCASVCIGIVVKAHQNNVNPTLRKVPFGKGIQD